MHNIPKDKKLTLADLKPHDANQLYWHELEDNIKKSREVIFHAQDILTLIRPKTETNEVLRDLATVLARDVLAQHQRLDSIVQRVNTAKAEHGDDQTAIMGLGLDIQSDFMDFVETNERLISPQIKDIMTYVNDDKPTGTQGN